MGDVSSEDPRANGSGRKVSYKAAGGASSSDNPRAMSREEEEEAAAVAAVDAAMREEAAARAEAVEVARAAEEAAAAAAEEAEVAAAVEAIAEAEKEAAVRADAKYAELIAAQQDTDSGAVGSMTPAAAATDDYLGSMNFAEGLNDQQFKIMLEAFAYDYGSGRRDPPPGTKNFGSEIDYQGTTIKNMCFALCAGEALKIDPILILKRLRITASSAFSDTMIGEAAEEFDFQVLVNSPCDPKRYIGRDNAQSKFTVWLEGGHYQLIVE